MQFTDILSFCFSILGLYGLVYYFRFLIPCNLLPYVSAVLTEAEHLLDRAESTGVILRPNEYRSALTLYKAFFCQRKVTSLIVTLAVTPINSCGFEWKAIVLLGYYNNFGSLFSKV